MVAMKPTATSRSGFTNSMLPSHHHVIITENPMDTQPPAAKRLCSSMHMQASKLSRCHGDTADRWPCELAYDSGPHKPTDSASGSASRQVVLAAQANTNSTTAYRKAPRCLDNFPCDQRGRQRRALGQNRAAAPQRRPRAREPFLRV